MHECNLKQLSELFAKQSIVAKTRKIYSNCRLLTQYQNEMVEILENMGVPDDNIHEIVRDLLDGC
jgi:hypothetical protein